MLRSLLKNFCLVLSLFYLASAVSAQSKIVLKEQSLSIPGMGTAQIMVPEDYQVEILNSQLHRPRMIEFAPNGDMFIGSASRIYLFKFPYDAAIDYLYLDDYPHSVAVRGDDMFIATKSTLYKTVYDPKALRITQQDLKVASRLPGGFGHSSRTVAIGPDGLVYVSLGISGNCSDQMVSMDYPFKERRGGIMVLDESTDVPKLVPFASGLRNPVGFDWHPISNVMYASNNGPDHLGFDIPPEYFSKITRGSFHGMPWYQYDGQFVLRDPCISSEPPYRASEVSVPVATFPARNAPLGVAFVPAGAMDQNFENNAIVALHGSWGTQPYGLFTGPAASRRPPALMMVQFEDGQAISTEVVVTGFQNEDGRRWARSAGVAIGPDGWLYITSDGGDIQGLLRLRRNEVN